MKTINKNTHCALFMFALFVRTASFAQLPDTIAVVPFQVVGETKNIDLLRLGFPDGLAHSLKQYKNIVVVSRVRLADVIQELHLMQSGLIHTDDAQKVGQMLPANEIVTGTIYKSGKTLQVNMQLIDVRTGEIIIELTEKEKLNKAEEIFKFQEYVSRQFAQRMQLKQTLSGYFQKSIPSMESYNHFIQAISYLYHGNMEAAKQEDAWALKIDPAFEQARSFDEELENAFKELDRAIDEMK